MAGWVKIHRSMNDHWIFSDAEYLRAWIVILMEVNHTESKVLVSGKLMRCMRGESLKSLDTWGRLFGSWSKNRVYRFLNLLKKDKMITMKSETVTTRLTVCNYEEYQGVGNGSSTEAEHGSEPVAEPNIERGRNTNKNVKNYKNEKNEKETKEDRVFDKKDRLKSGIDPYNANSDPEFLKLWNACPRKQGQHPAYLAWQDRCDFVTTDALVSAMEAQAAAGMIGGASKLQLKGWIEGKRWCDEVVETDDHRKSEEKRSAELGSMEIARARENRIARQKAAKR